MTSVGAMNETPTTMHLDDLLTHEDWLRALARTLVYDEHRAEDLVHETWLKAITQPPRVLTNVRGWLGTVLRNEARRTARSERSRRRREEQSSLPEAQASTGEIVERIATQRRVLGCLLQLEEPYREALLLHYYEDLTSGEIATRLAIPRNTAKSRILRGVTKLRERLSTEFGDHRTWQAALLPIAGTSHLAPWKPGVVASGIAGVLAMKATILVAVLALGAWFFSLDPRPTNRSEGVRHPSGIEDASVVMNESSDVLSATTRIETEPVPVMPPAAASDDLPSRATEDGLRLVVTREGAPVAGALVTFLSVGRLVPDDVTSLEFGLLGISDLLRQRGERLRTDALGTVVVPRDSLGAVAEHEGVRAWQRLQGIAGDETELALQPVHALTIRTFDGRGEPLPDVPVVVGFVSPKSPEQNPTPTGGNGVMAIWRGRTGTEGVLVTDRALDGLELMQSTLELVATLDYPDGDAQLVPIDPSGANADVRLTVGGSGSVQVHVVDADGKRVTERVLVNLFALPSGAEEIGPPTAMHVQRSADGFAVYDHVGLGLELVAQVITPANRSEALVRRFFGPTMAGETIDVHVSLQGTAPAVAGRLIDEEQQPLANGTFVANLEQGTAQERSMFMGTLTTDEAGFFRYELPRSSQESEVRILHVRPFAVRPSEEAREATLELSGVRTGTVQVGDVVLARDPIVLAGRVVDEAGEGVPGVALYGVWSDDAGNDGSLRETMTNDDGQFVLRDEAPAGRAKILVRCTSHYLAQPVELSFPQTGVVLALQRAARVAGKILVDEGVDVARLNVVCETERRTVESRVHPDGAFELGGLEPGRTAFRVVRPDEARTLFALEDVEVRSDGSTDERLASIDLRARLHVGRYVLRQASGRALRRVKVRAVLVGLEERDLITTATTRRGALELLTTFEPTEVELRVDDRRWVTVPWSSSERVVEIPEAITVDLKLGAFDVSDGVGLEVSLQPADPDIDRETFHAFPRAVDERGHVTFAVPKAGSYELTFWVSRGNTMRAVSMTDGVRLSIRDEIERAIDIQLPEEVRAELKGR